MNLLCSVPEILPASCQFPKNRNLDEQMSALDAGVYRLYGVPIQHQLVYTGYVGCQASISWCIQAMWGTKPASAGV